MDNWATAVDVATLKEKLEWRIEECTKSIAERNEELRGLDWSHRNQATFDIAKIQVYTLERLRKAMGKCLRRLNRPISPHELKAIEDVFCSPYQMFRVHVCMPNQNDCCCIM